MIFTLLVKVQAVEDITEAFSWYEQKRTGLGTEFLNEVEELFDRITQNPGHYQSHRDQRIAVMHRFPYKLCLRWKEKRLLFMQFIMISETPKNYLTGAN